MGQVWMMITLLGIMFEWNEKIFFWRVADVAQHMIELSKTSLSTRVKKKKMAASCGSGSALWFFFNIFRISCAAQRKGERYSKRRFKRFMWQKRGRKKDGNDEQWAATLSARRDKTDRRKERGSKQRWVKARRPKNKDLREQKEMNKRYRRSQTLLSVCLLGGGGRAGKAQQQGMP